MPARAARQYKIAVGVAQFAMQKLLCAVFFVFVAPALAGPLDETRYADHVVRNADGSIHRSAAVTAAFQRIHPCPSTQLKTGPCPGYAKNHVIPLACGGIDAVSNIVWLRLSLKTCPKTCVDQYELKISARDPPVPGSICVNKIIK